MKSTQTDKTATARQKDAEAIKRIYGRTTTEEQLATASQKTPDYMIDRLNAKPDWADEPQAQHSPLPWKLLDGAILSEQVNDYGNFIIVESPRRYADETTQQDERNMRLIVASVNNAQALAEALRELSDQTQLARKYIVLDDDNGLAAYHATAKAWNEAHEALANWDQSNGH